MCTLFVHLFAYQPNFWGKNTQMWETSLTVNTFATINKNFTFEKNILQK